ncbi:DUF1102 domain-containing protein [Halorubrum trapanicum]|uniref:DUF1102 domain-containing protein n=1 Tax=Halorubrum trapanicum TaxID=29284 RepID=UPI000BBB20D1|nr:DUF1102 domain-containing protein [Halorubrum trapanicum]
MERRKFVVGLGALATGTAAATGTGAFSQATVSGRSVSVAIADDSEGFVGLDTSYEGLQNSQYASETEDGELQLQFNSEANQPGGGFLNDGAEGLTQNSEYYFDGVFAIEHAGQFDEYGNVAGISIDDSGLDNPDSIRFYWEVGDAGGRDTDLSEGNVGISAGTYASIGVYIETPDEMPDNPAEWETGSITIIAENSE